MKKALKPNNPLKTFNDSVAMAHMKAGGQMKAYNKYLKKLQDGGGSGMGRMAADDASFQNMLNQYPASPPAKPWTPPAGIGPSYESIQRSKNLLREVPQATPQPVSSVNPYRQKRGGAVKTKKRK
jgi:hypothetical protein